MKKLFFMFGITLVLTGCKTVAPLFVSDPEEKDVGKQYHQYLLDSLTKEGKIISSTESKSVWIDSLGKSLAKQQDREGFTEADFTFTVVNEDVINAFALPGGYIYIYEGLIKKVGTVDQIAGVLSHEIGHVAAKHYKEVMMKEGMVDLLSKVVLGDKQSVAVNLGKYLIATKTSRMNEYEADSLSITYLADDGVLSPWGMKNFLDTLATLGSGGAEILSTHPNSDKRAADVKRIIERDYPRQGEILDGKPNPYHQ